MLFNLLAVLILDIFFPYVSFFLSFFLDYNWRYWTFSSNKYFSLLMKGREGCHMNMEWYFLHASLSSAAFCNDSPGNRIFTGGVFFVGHLAPALVLKGTCFLCLLVLLYVYCTFCKGIFSISACPWCVFQLKDVQWSWVALLSRFCFLHTKTQWRKLMCVCVCERERSNRV